MTNNFSSISILTKYIHGILIGIILGGWLLSVDRCNHYKYQSQDLSQNLIAAQDTIREYSLKNGNLLHEKNAYILNEKTLEQNLDLAKNEIKELKSKLKSDFNTITKIETQIQYDSIIIIQPVETPIKFNQDFNYTEQWLKFNGNINIDSVLNLRLYNISIPTDLVVGTTKDKRVFVETKNPYIQIKNISGAVLSTNQKKPHWSFGLGMGIGAQYGLINKNIDIGPQLTCGLLYTF